jgi:hypothetical protein
MASAPSFVAYVDESGDEGFKFSQGSSRWFVVSALVVRRTNDQHVVLTADNARRAMGLEKRATFHFRKLAHEKRLPLVAEIAKGPFRLISIVIDKRSIDEPDTFQKKNILYFYAMRYLLERVSWVCRDKLGKHDPGDGTVHLVFSQRQAMKYADLLTYLNRLRERDDVTIEWSVITPDLSRVTAVPHAQRAGLLLADAVASACYFAVEERYGFTEEHYIRVLRPIFYERDKVCLRYGLKFWPAKCESLFSSDPLLKWVLDHFKS